MAGLCGPHAGRPATVPTLVRWPTCHCPARWVVVGLVGWRSRGRGIERHAESRRQIVYWLILPFRGSNSEAAVQVWRGTRMETDAPAVTSRGHDYWRERASTFWEDLILAKCTSIFMWGVLTKPSQLSQTFWKWKQIFYRRPLTSTTCCHLSIKLAFSYTSLMRRSPLVQQFWTTRIIYIWNRKERLFKYLTATIMVSVVLPIYEQPSLYKDHKDAIIVSRKTRTNHVLKYEWDCLSRLRSHNMPTNTQLRVV